jgi:hypothetical protein
MVGDQISSLMKKDSDESDQVGNQIDKNPQGRLEAASFITEGNKCRSKSILYPDLKNV